jgi:hypothetical protein
MVIDLPLASERGGFELHQCYVRPCCLLLLGRIIDPVLEAINKRNGYQGIHVLEGQAGIGKSVMLRLLLARLIQELSKGNVSLYFSFFFHFSLFF